MGIRRPPKIVCFSAGPDVSWMSIRVLCVPSLSWNNRIDFTSLYFETSPKTKSSKIDSSFKNGINFDVLVSRLTKMRDIDQLHYAEFPCSVQKCLIYDIHDKKISDPTLKKCLLFSDSFYVPFSSKLIHVYEFFAICKAKREPIWDLFSVLWPFLCLLVLEII